MLSEVSKDHHHHGTQ